ncbi:MAG: glycosyltransferase family 2 protein [Bacteroidia bacterium]|nr:glycosyltransferase family 2 protein [Bacteroidia bacterium]
MNTPLISIIMPVYNGEKFLKASIESILNQTYQNYELIILNDGSTDASEKICLRFTDKRIRYHYHSNMGLAKTLNRGIELAKGRYLARQDHDDISMQDRLEKQVCYLENNKDVLLVGTCGNIIDEHGKYIGKHQHPTLSSVLHFDLMFDNPFIHSSVMFKKEHNGKKFFYPENPDIFEDYGMWSEMSFYGKVVNLDYTGILYRHHEAGISKMDPLKRKKMLFLQSKQNLLRLLTGIGDEEEILSLCKLYFHQYTKNDNFDKKLIIQTLYKIAQAIEQKYPDEKKWIAQRLRQYKKVIGSRYNMFMRYKNEKNILKLFWLKVEHKLKNYKSYV